MSRKLRIKTQRPWIAYPGSTIQQNFGETPDKGFLCWDISDRGNFDVKFHALHNDNAFVTINWLGTIQETLAAIGIVTKNSRIRIRSSETISQSEIRQLYSELRMLYDPIEIVIKIDANDLMLSTGPDSMNEIEDIRDPDIIIGLMQEFLKSVEIDSADWLTIRGFIERYIKSLIATADTTAHHTKWSVKRLEFDNTFAFGRDNVIDFDKLHGVVGVFAPNARGKSSIIGTLMYALFNSTDRGSIKNLHIINTRKGECSANVVINVNGNDYKIERKTVKKEPKKGFIHGVTNLEFYRIDSDGKKIEDATGEMRTDTEKEIRRLIGTADDFLITSLASQGDTNRFINEGATQRKTILARMLDLDIFDQMFGQAKDESNGIKALLKNAPDRDWNLIVDGLEQEISNGNLELQRIGIDITTTRDKLQDAQIRLAKLNQPDTITQADVDEQELLIAGFNNKLQAITNESNETVNQHASLLTKLEKIASFKSNFPIAALKSQKVALDTTKNALIGMQHSLQTEQTLLKQQEASVKKLADVPCGDSFPSCKFIKDSHTDRQKIELQRERVNEMVRHVASTRDVLEKMLADDVDGKISKYNDLLKNESDIQLQLAKIETRKAGFDKDTEYYQIKLTDASDRLSDILKKVVTGNVSDELNTCRKSVNSLNSKLNTMDIKRLSILETLTRHKMQLERSIEERDSFSLLRNKWRLYEHMTSALSKRGIPSQIIHRLLPKINVELAKILQGVVEFTVALEVDTESNSMDIFIDYGDSKRIIELASGMEKMIASIAIRVALINISSLPKTDMFIIDEGFGTLDESNIAACGRLLESLKQWFRIIIVISHIDGIKDAADTIIELTRHGKDSHVEYA